MDTLEAIYARRAMKQYDPEHVMPEEDIKKLLEATMQAPTSFNMQNWRFVVVQDKELRKKLRAAAVDQAQVTDASILIILTADLKAWAKEPARYWKNAPTEVAELLSNWMGPFYEGKDELQRDEAMRSVGIAAQTIMLAAKAMGYDSCPMIGYDPEPVAELIGLPEDHTLGMFVTVGKATGDTWPKPGQLSFDEVVIRDRF